MPKQPAYEDQEVLADAAYVGEAIEKELVKRGYVPLICEKGYRGPPLTEEQKATNSVKASVRCRIEHLFGAKKAK